MLFVYALLAKNREISTDSPFRRFNTGGEPYFTTGTVHKSKMPKPLTKEILGKVFTDAVYQLKADALKKMSENGKF